jgi:hypothetical protein
MDKIIRPDMVLIFSVSVTKPQSGLLRLFGWNLKSYFSPNPSHPLMINLPAFLIQQSCDSLIPISTILTGKTSTLLRINSSSSICFGSYLCVARHCPRTRQARRSDTPKYSMAFSTISLRRAGLTSFPRQHPSMLPYPGSNPLPIALTEYSLSLIP